jgi:hypothetical protein
VTHLVYGVKPDENVDDKIGYCRMAPGTDTCRETPKVFTLPPDCHRQETDVSYGAGPHARAVAKAKARRASASPGVWRVTR